MESILVLFLEYKYVILFPLVVFEGPFATIISGFLISIHIFNIYIAYSIIILGDLVGDSMFYSIGRWGGPYLLKYGVRFKITQEKLDKAKKYFTDHHHTAIITSKLAHGIGVTGLMAAGALRISFYKYIKTCFYIALAQSAVLLAIGFFSGYAYSRVFAYLDNYAKIISGLVLCIIGLFLFFKLSKQWQTKKGAKQN